MGYNKRNGRLEAYVERYKYQYNIFFDFETITPEYNHMPYLCWIYNDDIQQEFIGINYCAVGMLNGLPTDKKEFLPIAHNSDYGCRLILEHLQNKKRKHIVKSKNMKKFVDLENLRIEPKNNQILQTHA